MPASAFPTEKLNLEVQIMNDVQIFNNPEFGEIRTVMIKNEPWFVGNDCAKALGYKNLYSGVSKNVDEEDRRLFPVGSASGIQDTTIINESGLYSLIFGSKLESAKKFKKWVTSDVLPSIRKNGGYGFPKLPQSPMELLELHYEAIKHVNGEVQQVRKELEDFKQDIPIFGEECTEINKAVTEKVHECLGEGSPACQEKRLHRRLYRDIYGQTNRTLGVSTYKSIKRSQFKKYIQLVNEYIPPIAIQSEIDELNSQIGLEL